MKFQGNQRDIVVDRYDKMYLCYSLYGKVFWQFIVKDYYKVVLKKKIKLN